MVHMGFGRLRALCFLKAPYFRKLACKDCGLDSAACRGRIKPELRGEKGLKTNWVAKLWSLLGYPKY